MPGPTQPRMPKSWGNKERVLNECVTSKETVFAENYHGYSLEWLLKKKGPVDSQVGPIAA